MNILLNICNEILLILMIKKKINNDQVIDFLEKNTDFFILNPDVLSQLNFPVRKKNTNQLDSKVIPFKDWIIENLKNIQKDIIENAKHNFFTQKKIHDSVIKILKINTLNDLSVFIREQLPKTFDLEVVNLVTSNKRISEEYSFIFKNEITIEKVYGKKNQLIMDAVDNELEIFDKSKIKIYSNAIFSLNLGFFSSPSLLVFGSKDKHFLDNKAFDLILFFSKVFQERLNQLSNE